MLRKFILFLMIVLVSSCAAFSPEKVDARKTPAKAEDRARKNIEEGKGASIGSLLGRTVEPIMNLVLRIRYGEHL